MIVEFDGGNTRLKWRLLSAGGAVLERGTLANEALLEGALQSTLSNIKPQRARMVSVAGADLKAAVAACVTDLWGLTLAQAHTQPAHGAIHNPYKDYTKLGADRWLAVLAAYELSQGPCLIVDCGSAITVELVSDQGYIGGYIVPGHRLMRRALFADTAQVKVEQGAKFDMAPGCSTEAAVNNGIHCAHVGLASQARRMLL
ncbi:MAG: type III pantothenate kinase, partial [Cellvibrionaceae bacterium]|nr:type III pantothenate kinase [Cellvibrionaceae bacterium]